MEIMSKTVTGDNIGLNATARNNDADKNPVGEAGRAAKELALKIHNLSIGNDDTTVGGGLRADAAAQTRAAERDFKKKKDEDTKARQHAILMDQLASLNARIAELDREIDGHRKNITTADNFIADLLAGRKPELDDDGSLKNKERERLIKSWEKRNGQTADRTDPNILLTIAHDQKAWEEGQLDTKLDERKGLIERKTIVENKLNEADSIQNREMRIAAKKETIRDESTATVNKAITDLNTQEQKNEIREARGYLDTTVNEFEARDKSGLGHDDRNVQIVDKGFNFTSAMSENFSPSSANSASKSIDGNAFENAVDVKLAFNAHATGDRALDIQPARTEGLGFTLNKPV